MSGYASQREVREVTEATLRMEGRDPADYSVAGIMRDAFYPRNPGYGALDEQTWRDAVTRHRKRQRSKPRPAELEAELNPCDVPEVDQPDLATEVNGRIDEIAAQVKRMGDQA